MAAAFASACGTILLVLAIAAANSVERAGGCGRPTKGTNAGERLTGTGKRELLRGRGGADAIRGRAGDDCVYGGQGGDMIDAGRGADRIHGGRGNDRILTRDGERDVVRCGLGHDDARVDRRDVVRAEKHCERVKRPDRASPPQPGPDPDLELRFASFENSLTKGTDGWSKNPSAGFTVTRTNEVGGIEGPSNYAAKIVGLGTPSPYSFARMQFQSNPSFAYVAGDEVWMSGAFRFPQSIEFVRLLTLAHYQSQDPAADWKLEFQRNGSTWRVVRTVGAPTYAATVVLGPYPAPANNVWTRVDLHFKLSNIDGQALTEMYVNGNLVGSSTTANMVRNTPLWFFQAGMGYWEPWHGSETLYLDQPRLTQVK